MKRGPFPLPIPQVGPAPGGPGAAYVVYWRLVLWESPSCQALCKVSKRCEKIWGTIYPEYLAAQQGNSINKAPAKSYFSQVKM